MDNSVWSGLGPWPRTLKEDQSENGPEGSSTQNSEGTFAIGLENENRVGRAVILTGGSTAL